MRPWGAGARDVVIEGVPLFGHAGRWRTNCGAEFQYRHDAISHVGPPGARSCHGTKETCPTKGVGHN